MAQLDLSLSDALSDCAAPGPEARVERDFVAQLEAEAFDDQIGETVGKTDYIPLLDGDDTAPDIGTALANGEKQAEGAQKPGSKVTAVMQPGRPEPHGEVRPRVDPPDLASDLLSAPMTLSPGALGSPTGPVQVMGFSPMGAFSGFPADRPPSVAEPQQHSPMLPEPQAPRGPLNLAPGASPLWSDTAPRSPADLPFTDSVSTVISRHANQLAPEVRPPRESVAYAGGDEKEGEGSDRKQQQKKKKKRRQKDEGSWDQPETPEAPNEGPAPADDPYQRVGPRRDKAAGGPGGPGGEGAWEEQIGKSGGRGKRGKSRKKLPEEWAATAEPSLPAGSQETEEMLVEVGAAAPFPPVPEEPFPGTEPGWGQEFHPEEGLVPDQASITASPAPLLVQSSGLKATAAPFTMPAGSSPWSPGPAYSLPATPHDHEPGDELDSGLFDTGVPMASFSPYPILTDTSVFSPASQLSPDRCLSETGASPRPTAPTESSWLAGDSGDSFDLGESPWPGCPLPTGVVLDATGPAPLRSPRTSAQDCRGPPRERPDEATANKKHRSSSSSSSSSLKSPTFSGPPSSGPPGDSPVPLASSPQTALGSPGSYLNPAAKPFFPGLNEPLEAPAVAPSVAPVMEDSQTPVKSDTKEEKMEESMEEKMDDSMERLDEYVQLDDGDRRSVRVELSPKEEEQEKHNKTATAEEKATEKEKQAEKVTEKAEDRVEKTPDKPPPPADTTGAKGAEEKAEKTIHVSGVHEDQETVVLEQTTPGEKKVKAVEVTEASEKPEAGDAKGTEVSKAPPSPEIQQSPVPHDATPEEHSDTSTKENQAEDTKVEVTKTDTAKVEKSKVEVTSVEDTKVEESKVEVTSVEDTKVEESKVKVSSVEDTKVEESKVKVSSVEDTKVEEPKVEVTSVEDTKVEEPKVEVTSVEDTEVEEPKVEVTSVEDTKVEEPKAHEPAVSVVKTEEGELTEERNEEAAPEQHHQQEEEKPVATAVETKEKAKEEVKKTAEKKEVKKEKAGKVDAVTKKPSAKPPAASLKEPPSPEKKTKPAATATKLLPATKARPVSAAAPPTRRPASALSATTSTTTNTTTFNNSTSISSPIAKKTLAARPATAPAAGAPKRAPGLASSRPSSSVTSTGPAPRDVRPKTTTTTTTTTERRALGSKVTTAPAARPSAGPAPSRNGTAAAAAASKTATAAASRTAAPRMTAAPRPALSTAAKKPLASKPDSKLAEDRKPGTLKNSADPPKPRTAGATAAAARTGAPKPASTGPTAAERKTLVSRAPRPAGPSSSTTTTTSTATRTSTSASGRPASRPGAAAPGPDPKNVRSKVGTAEKTKASHTGVKVSSNAQSKAAAAKDPAKVPLDFRKPDFSHITSRLGSKENLKHVPGGGNVQILSKKVDLSKVTSKCGSKDNIKHKPGGGVVKIESHKVNFKDKAQSKVGSMDNLLGIPGKGDGSQEPAAEGSVEAPAVSAEQGAPEAPAAAAATATAQENGLKEGGACGAEGLCDAPVLDTRIPETSI